MRIAQKAIAAYRDHGRVGHRPRRPPALVVRALGLADCAAGGLPSPGTWPSSWPSSRTTGDTYIGAVPRYEWGRRIYGGQVIAQALWAAAARSQRNARSTRCTPTSSSAAGWTSRSATRSTGSATAVVHDPASRRPPVLRGHPHPRGLLPRRRARPRRPDGDHPADVPGPEELPEQGWGWMLERRGADDRQARAGPLTWVRVDPAWATTRCSRPAGWRSPPTPATVTAVALCTPRASVASNDEVFMGASLDHAVWFHRPARPTAGC